MPTTSGVQPSSTPEDVDDPLTAQTGFSAAERRLRAQAAANARWSRQPDRVGAMAPARAGQMRMYEKQVDPDGLLPPAERAKLAENARRAHLQSMSLKAARARRLRRTGGSR